MECEATRDVLKRVVNVALKVHDRDILKAKDLEDIRNLVVQEVVMGVAATIVAEITPAIQEALRRFSNLSEPSAEKEKP